LKIENKLIIGLGTGRCGTVSLYRLLNFQRNSFFTHESKPLLTWNFDKNIDKKLKKFLKRKEKYVGDVNSCYLPYIDYILRKYPLTKCIVLKRPKQEVIKSFIKQTKTLNHNYWIKHDGKKWRKAKKWDNMHPKYKVKTKEEAIEKYWEDYNKKIKQLIKKYPKSIKIFKTKDFNFKKSVKEILNFAEINLGDQQIKINIKENKSNSFIRFVKYFFWKGDKL